jgi:hypothetical protein
MTLYSTVRGDLADWIRGAITFEVQPGDYYGTGRLPEVDQGQFLADYTFCEMSGPSMYSHNADEPALLDETVRNEPRCAGRLKGPSA